MGGQCCSGSILLPNSAAGSRRHKPRQPEDDCISEVIDMARMKGIETHEAPWFTRLLYWFVQRGVAKNTGRSRLVEPIKITAHHPRLLRAVGQMEMGQEAARSVPTTLKA